MKAYFNRYRNHTHICGVHVWPLLLAAVLLALSAKSTIYQRHQTQQLNRQLESARQENLVLRDELRSLQLEYASITDYEALHTTAEMLKMHEPNFHEGNLVFLSDKSDTKIADDENSDSDDSGGQ